MDLFTLFNIKLCVTTWNSITLTLTFLLVEERCILSNPSCATVNCDNFHLSGIIRPEVFGIGSNIYRHYSQHDAIKALSVNDGICNKLVWDMDETVFRINTTLLDCGMVYEAVPALIGDDEYWQFKHKITTPNLMLQGAVLTKGITINLMCRYPTERF